MVPSLESMPAASKNYEINPWADYVELSCLMHPDKEISIDDMMRVSTQEEIDSFERGTEEASESEDRFKRLYKDIFSYLSNRALILGDDYPFRFIDDDTISIELEALNEKGKVYLFLLYCSNLARFTRTERYRLTKEFESISKCVLKIIYPGFHVEIFGTASSEEDLFYGGKLIERFEKLAACLNTTVKRATRNNGKYQIASGDGGLDLVGFTALDGVGAEAPFIPLCFAQCACSFDKWNTKQGEIQFDTWNQRLEQISRYPEFIFVPFSLRGPDGKWCSSEEDHIKTIPVDRIRFLHIIRTSDEALDFFSKSEACRIITESIDSL